MQVYLMVASLALYLSCIIMVLQQPGVEFAGFRMNPVLRVLMVLIMINLVGLTCMQLAWIGKFLLLPLQLLIDTMFGTSFW